MARTVSSRRAAQAALAALSNQGEEEEEVEDKGPARAPAPRVCADPNPYQLRKRDTAPRYASDGEEQTDEDDILPGSEADAERKGQNGFSSDLSSQEDSDGDEGARRTKVKGPAKRVPKKAAQMQQETAAERLLEAQAKELRPTASFSNVPLKESRQAGQPSPSEPPLLAPVPRFIPPPPSTALLAMHRDALFILNSARLEATRDESLQSASRRAVDVALEALRSREQQEAFCQIMNRYTSFCTSPTTDIPIFPITVPKLLLFLLRIISSPLGSSLLGLLPQPNTHQLPLTTTHANLARTEGPFVSQELVRCWCEALQYGQIAGRAVWERVLPHGSEGRVLILRDERVDELLRQVESIDTLEARVAYEEQQRDLERQRQQREATVAGAEGAGESAVEPSTKKARWSRGGRPVDGPSPAQGSTSPPEGISRLNIAPELSSIRTEPTASVPEPSAAAELTKATGPTSTPSAGSEAKTTNKQRSTRSPSVSLACSTSRRSSLSLPHDPPFPSPAPRAKSTTGPSSRRSSLSISVTHSPAPEADEARASISPVHSRRGSRKGSISLVTELAETNANSVSGSPRSADLATRSRRGSVASPAIIVEVEEGEKENADGADGVVTASEAIEGREPSAEEKLAVANGRIEGPADIEVNAETVVTGQPAAGPKGSHAASDNAQLVQDLLFVEPKPLTQAELEAALVAVHGFIAPEPSVSAGQKRPHSRSWDSHAPRQFSSQHLYGRPPHPSDSSRHLFLDTSPSGLYGNAPFPPRSRPPSRSFDPYGASYGSSPRLGYLSGYSTYSSPYTQYSHPHDYFGGGSADRFNRYSPSQPRLPGSTSAYGYSPQSQHQQSSYDPHQPQFPLPALPHLSRPSPSTSQPQFSSSQWTPTGPTTSKEGAMSMLLDGDGGGGEMSQAYSGLDTLSTGQSDDQSTTGCFPLG